MDTANKILAAFKTEGKPLKSAELAALTGVSKSETDSCLKQLLKEEKIYTPKRCYYSLNTKK